MQVLIVGDMRVGTNARSVADGYAEAGFRVRMVDTSNAATAPIGSSLWRSIRLARSVTSIENERLRAAVAHALEGFVPDLVLAIKTIFYDQTIILDVPATSHVHLSFDDVSNTDNTSAGYLEMEHHWDVVLTTKQHNVAELLERGVKEVELIWGAYDPRYQKQTTPFREREFDVGFIGAARADRMTLPREMAANLPSLGVIYGPRWRRKHPFGVRGVALRKNAIDSGYTEASNSFRIGLVLLNSENRDTHTNRTFETAAAGQLILAQRTREHESLFVEGVEALFFQDRDEAWSICRSIIREPNRAAAIASAGYDRVLSGRNTYKDRAIQFVAKMS